MSDEIRMLDAALETAKRGVKVIPLKPGTKLPLSAHGSHDATTDLETIKTWWTETPEANLGVATGTRNELLVVDLDGKEGIESWEELEREYGRVETLTSSTGNGGRHLFFRTDKKLKNTAGVLGRGVDTRAEGGYVVVPPSRHPTGSRYTWAEKRSPADCPTWLEAFVQQEDSRSDLRSLSPPVISHETTTAYGRAALDGLADDVARATQGTRNDTLNRSAYRAGQLAAAGAITEVDARAALLHAADACRLRPSEAERTFTSGWSAGLLEPAVIPERQNGVVDALDPGPQSATDGPETQPEESSGRSRGEGARGRPSQATQLVELVAELDVELFHTPHNETCASIWVDGHRETWPIKSKNFKQYLAHLFYARHHTAPNSQALQGARDVLHGRALFDGEQHELHTRLAEANGAIYLDLADRQWRAVRINSAGWTIETAPPVRFRRARGMEALPVPLPSGSIELLRPYLNVEGKDGWNLSVAWLVAAFRPRGPFPIYANHGEQGTAKSTNARVLRELIDPNEAPLRSAPRDVRDFLISATNSWLIVFDNVSSLSQHTSDALCRLSTGGGFAARELYSDADEVILRAQRPAILNGIVEVIQSGDLLDRAILVNAPLIEPDARRDEERFWRDFESDRPAILGALLRAVSTALARIDEVELDRAPRMADFTRWVTAAEPALGWDAGTFINSYSENQEQRHELAVESTLIGRHLVEIARHEGGFSGTATQLLRKLDDRIGDDPVRQRKDWPKEPRALSGQLTRLAPNLRALGVVVERGREPGTGRRMIELRLQRSVTSVTTGTESRAS